MNAFLVAWILFALLGTACIVVMWLRNDWVFRQKMAYSEQAFEFIMWCTNHDRAAYKRYSGRLYDTLDDYDTMWLRFWSWNVESLVVDHEVWNAVQDFHQNRVAA